MISVQFFARHMLSKQAHNSQPMYFQEYSEAVQRTIDINMNNLRRNLLGFRVVCVIGNVDDLEYTMDVSKQ